MPVFPTFSSSRRPAPALAAAGLVLALAVCLGLPLRAELTVVPSPVRLTAPESSAQLLVTQSRPSGPPIDRTHEAAYRVAAGRENAATAKTSSDVADGSSDVTVGDGETDRGEIGQDESGQAVVRVDAHGRVVPVREGTGWIVVRVGDQQTRVPVEVSGLDHPAPVSFRHEVIAGLTKAGCNSGGCHGKAEGQNGFKLSVFGFDAEADHAALVKEARGRRINPAAPEHSLLLRKATAAIPHGGGRQIDESSFLYGRLLRWIREGAALEADESIAPVAASVEPTKRVLPLGGSQQLRVTVIDQAGRVRDVTAEAEFESNDTTIAAVDSRGRVQASDIPGEAAVLVRYMGHVAVCRITVPQPDVEFPRPPENNFIDRLVWDKLEQMGIPPSAPAGDAVFLRRVYLDTLGTLPHPDEARRFLADPDPDKRAALIDTLLEREEYALYWSLRWADILRVDSNALGSESAVAMTRWLREQFEQNRPYDEFAREIVTARGHSQSQSPAPMFTILNEPKEMARSFSQLFLGVRIECAECHHHPFERWSQEDFFAFAGFFTGLKKKKTPDGGTVVFPADGNDLKHPRTGQVVPTAPLGGPALDLSAYADRREALAEWMTAADNPFFAKTLANRLWAHYFGRGLVEPLDDLRATNPATNEPLLEALADHLRDVDYDLKAFTRTLLNSRVYQLSAEATPANAADVQNFSHALQRPLPAEVLLDAICQVTEVPEKFNGWPRGARALEVWDNRMPSYFLRIFGRPGRTTVCACERGDAPSITQALHLMNSPEIVGKIQHRHGRARRLADSTLTPSEIVDALYLAALSRFPTASERKVLMRVGFRDGGPRGRGAPELTAGADDATTEEVRDRRAATEDILWVLLNSKEFLYNH